MIPIFSQPYTFLTFHRGLCDGICRKGNVKAELLVIEITEAHILRCVSAGFVTLMANGIKYRQEISTFLSSIIAGPRRVADVEV